jgi:hypothetical protein
MFPFILAALELSIYFLLPVTVSIAISALLHFANTNHIKMYQQSQVKVWDESV